MATRPPGTERTAGAGSRGSGRSARRRARELAVQGLYQWLVGGQDAAAIEGHLAESRGRELAEITANTDMPHYRELLNGAIDGAEALRAEFAPYLDRGVEALSPIEHGILLLATYELKHRAEIPYRVDHQRGGRAREEFRRYRGLQVRQRRARQGCRTTACDGSRDARLTDVAGYAMAAPEPPIGEFELIARYFQRGSVAATPHVELGIGDDCALIDGGPADAVGGDHRHADRGRPLSCPTWIQRRSATRRSPSTFRTSPPAARRRAASFSRWRFPSVDEAWLAAFTRGLFALGDRHRCVLAGGDTTRSARGRDDRDHGARGGAARQRVAAVGRSRRRRDLGLGHAGRWRTGPRLPVAARSISPIRLQGRSRAWSARSRGWRSGSACAASRRARSMSPTDWPEISGISWSGRASRPRSAGARSRALLRCSGYRRTASGSACSRAGDDYELLFTAPPTAAGAVESAAAGSGVTVARIGTIHAGRGPEGALTNAEARWTSRPARSIISAHDRSSGSLGDAAGRHSRAPAVARRRRHGA